MMNEIRLRRLEDKDAPFMLEWMQDSTIACFFRFDADKMTLDSCRAYIENANQDDASRHYAIVDNQDEYLGTISLKDIHPDKKEAEYAISTRRKAHGTGAAMLATEQLFQIAFEELGMQRIFLNVLTNNVKANKFYQKVGFSFDRTESHAVEIRGEWKSLNWYSITKEEYLER